MTFHVNVSGLPKEKSTWRRDARESHDDVGHAGLGIPVIIEFSNMAIQPPPGMIPLDAVELAVMGVSMEWRGCLLGQGRGPMRLTGRGRR